MSALNRRHAAAGLVAGLGVAAGAWIWPRGEDPAVVALTTLFEREFHRPDGQPLTMASFRGRPLLVNFWATWCPPCVRELPELDRFQQQHQAQGWQVVGIALDQAEAVRGFLARTPVSFPVAVAGLDNLSLMQALGNSGGGLPFSLMVSGDGRLLHRKLGATQFEELQAWAASAR